MVCCGVLWCAVVWGGVPSRPPRAQIETTAAQAIPSGETASCVVMSCCGMLSTPIAKPNCNAPWHATTVASTRFAEARGGGAGGEAASCMVLAARRAVVGVVGSASHECGCRPTHTPPLNRLSKATVREAESSGIHLGRMSRFLGP